jgi:hypothetical protein
MTPLDFILSKLNADKLGGKNPQDQMIAALLCDLMQEVARTRARYYPAPWDGDGINSWRDQTRMLESDLLDWLISFAISRFADEQTTDQYRIRDTLAHRIELYRELNTEKAA